jgi:hypothetical protein
VTAEGNGDDGADLEEDLPSDEENPNPLENDGNFEGRAVASSFSSNGDDGIAVRQNLPGSGVLRLVNVSLQSNDDDPFNAVGVTVTQVP